MTEPYRNAIDHPGHVGNDAVVWQIGQTRVTRVLEFEVPAPRELLAVGDDPDAVVARAPWAQPHFVTDDGLSVFALAATCVEAGSQRVVIDPCISLDDRMQGSAAASSATDFLDGAMTAAGWSPDTVDLVVNTHVDGLGWNVRPDDRSGVRSGFPNAAHVWTAAEIDRTLEARDGDADRLRPLLAAGVVTPVSAPCSLGEGIRLEPSEGHTPGNVDVWIESDGEAAVVVGDTFVSALQVAAPDWRELDMAPDLAVELRRELLGTCVDRGALLIGPHFGSPGGGWVRSDDHGWCLAIEPV